MLAATIVVAGWTSTAEAQVFKVGSFTKNTTATTSCSSSCPTNVVAHGLGVAPDSIIFWTNGKTSASGATGSSSYWFSFGFSDGTGGGSVGTTSLDGAASATYYRRIANKAINIVTTTQTIAADANITARDATNFTLSWSNNDTNAYIIHYLAMGGGGMQAKVVSWPNSSATGDRPVTGVGFEPDVVMHLHAYGDVGNVGTVDLHTAFGLGVMDAYGGQWATTIWGLGAASKSNTQRGQQTDSSFYAIHSSLVQQERASFVSMDPDGFTQNFSDSYTSGGVFYSLALKGVSVHSGNFTKNTTSASGCSSGCPTNVVTGVGFQPAAVFLTSFGDVAQANPVVHTHVGVGASDGTTEGSVAFWEPDNLGTMQVLGADKTSKVFMKGLLGSTSIAAEADLASFNADGFALSWTTNDIVATEMLYIAFAPLSATAVTLTSFNATRYDRGVLAEWRTGNEVDNLGFHVYRDVGGQRTRVTKSLIAGSGLMAGQGITTNGEKQYAIWDTDVPVDPSAVYWLEDLDFKGTSRWHGPYVPIEGGLNAPNVAISSSLGAMGKGLKRRGKVFVAGGARLERPRKSIRTSVAAVQRAMQWSLASQRAIKIGVTHPAWYRVTQSELVASGLDNHVDPRTLRLFVEGVEQAIVVTGEADGHFDSADSIEFYGTGVDTPYTDLRTYWLMADGRQGQRISVHPAPANRSANAAPNFAFTLQHKERSIFFAALLNGEDENWFGALVSEEPTELDFNVTNLDSTASAGELEVVLQGVTATPGIDPDHHVSILLNGIELGIQQFVGQARGTETFAIPPGLLHAGENTVTLVARGGEEDYSLVDVVRLRYGHTYRADADLLRLTVDGPGAVTIGGFSGPAIRIVDITDPLAAESPRGIVAPDGAGGWSITVRVPGLGLRTLLAFTDATVATAASVRPNHPSQWHLADNTGA